MWIKLCHDDFLQMVMLSPQVSSCWYVVQVSERVAVPGNGEFGARPVAPPENAVVIAMAASNIGEGNYKSRGYCE